MTSSTQGVLVSGAALPSRGRSHECRGSATIETIIALLALTPFLIGLPLLGKQLDVKHKTYDALRYSVWERTVWSGQGTSNAKSDADIALEVQDRVLGDPSTGLLAPAPLRAAGISENLLWRDHRRQRLLDHSAGTALSATFQDRAAPVPVGELWVPGLAHGGGPIDALAHILRVDDLSLNRRAFADVAIALGMRPVLSQMAERPITLTRSDPTDAQESPLRLRATGAVLSDAWSSHDERDLRRRVDDVTANEWIEDLERPSRELGLQALGKGQPLYGEGQYAWDPDLRPRSAALPAAYIYRRDQ